MDFGVLFLIVVALLMVVGSFMGVASKKPTAPPSEPKPVTVKGADSEDSDDEHPYSARNQFGVETNYGAKHYSLIGFLSDDD